MVYTTLIIVSKHPDCQDNWVNWTIDFSTLLIILFVVVEVVLFVVVLLLLVVLVVPLSAFRDVDDDGALVGDAFAFVDVDDVDDPSCRRCNTLRVDKVNPDKSAKTMAWGCTAAEDLEDGSNEIAATTVTVMLLTIPMVKTEESESPDLLLPLPNHAVNSKVSKGSNNLITCTTDAEPYMKPTLVHKLPNPCNPAEINKSVEITIMAGIIAVAVFAVFAVVARGLAVAVAAVAAVADLPCCCCCFRCMRCNKKCPTAVPNNNCNDVTIPVIAMIVLKSGCEEEDTCVVAVVVAAAVLLLLHACTFRTQTAKDCIAIPFIPFVQYHNPINTPNRIQDTIQRSRMAITLATEDGEDDVDENDPFLLVRFLLVLAISKSSSSSFAFVDIDNLVVDNVGFNMIGVVVGVAVAVVGVGVVLVLVAIIVVMVLVSYVVSHHCFWLLLLINCHCFTFHFLVTLTL